MENNVFWGRLGYKWSRWSRRLGLLAFLFVLQCGMPSRCNGQTPRTDNSRLPFTKVVLRTLREQYVEPERLLSRPMFLAALDALQKQWEEVLVVQDESSVRVQMGTEKATFEVPHSISDLYARLCDVAAMARAQLATGATDRQHLPRDIESTLVNGMLESLDPHSQAPNVGSDFYYNDLQGLLRPSFGGLGLVIQLRRGRITVGSVLPNTPASAAGVQVGDFVRSIDGVDAAHMDLNEGVGRLRGDVQTQVQVCFGRDSRQSDSCLPMRRDLIQKPDVEGFLLEKDGRKTGVAYVAVHHFSTGCADRVQAMLDRFKKEHGAVQGVVLDLQGNGGGLLSEAIGLVDLFLSQGEIVRVFSKGNFEKEQAQKWTDWEQVPLVVLIDAGSASASEIVAGALRYNDRALVVGEKTFGKGSVQGLFNQQGGPVQPSDLAQQMQVFKITTAQYLLHRPRWLPAASQSDAVSIQSVGVAPDVALQPMIPDLHHPRFFRPARTLKERDLQRSLRSRDATQDAPPLTLRYLWREKLPPDREDDAEQEEWLWEVREHSVPKRGKWEHLFPLQFAFRVLSEGHVATGAVGREMLLNKAAAVLAPLQQQELANFAARLQVDWSTGTTAAPALRTSLHVQDPPSTSVASSSGWLELVCEVTNADPSNTAYQIRGQLDSTNVSIHDREVVFGRIPPNTTVSKVLRIPLPGGRPARQDTVQLKLFQNETALQSVATMDLKIPAQARPQFSYRVDLQDATGDGKMQPGEAATLRVTFKNIGEGKALRPTARLASLDERQLDAAVGGKPPLTKVVFVDAGRFDMGSFDPNAEQMVEFRFSLKNTYRAETVRFYLALGDRALQTDFLVDRIVLPVDHSRGAATTSSVTSPGALRSWAVTPPRIDVETVPLTTDRDRIRLKLTASHPGSLLDTYVVVETRRPGQLDSTGEHKVYYQRYQEGSPQSIQVDTDVPLGEGTNYIQVVVRQSAQVKSTYPLIVNRTMQSGRRT